MLLRLLGRGGGGRIRVLRVEIEVTKTLDKGNELILLQERKKEASALEVDPDMFTGETKKNDKTQEEDFTYLRLAISRPL